MKYLTRLHLHLHWFMLLEGIEMLQIFRPQLIVTNHQLRLK